MSVRNRLFATGRAGTVRELGLLVLRLGFGGALLLFHGWGKLSHFAERADRFPDPLGVGSAASLGLAVFAEVFCAVALILGRMGRLATIPLVITFVVAFFMVHGGDPFGEKEKAFLFLVAFVALMLTGPGRFSIDGLIRRR